MVSQLLVFSGDQDYGFIEIGWFSWDLVLVSQALEWFVHMIRIVVLGFKDFK